VISATPEVELPPLSNREIEKNRQAPNHRLKDAVALGLPRIVPDVVFVFQVLGIVSFQYNVA
jgi:hypothetical protein